jgi:uncharacterized protein (TIRG00374 family)
MKTAKKILSIILRIGISICLIIFLLKKVDIHQLGQILKTVDLRLLLLSFCFSLVSYILCFYRWRMLLVAIGVNLPAKEIITPFLGGIFFSLFLPSTIGGDVVRGADLALYTKKTKEVLASVLLDRLSGYIGMVLVVVLALSFGYKYVRQPSIIISTLILCLVLASALLVLFNPFVFKIINNILPSNNRVTAVLKNMHQEVFAFRLNPKLLFNNLFFSLFIQILGPIISYLVALALHTKISIIYFLVLMPIIGAISMLPISIGGLGLRDASSIFFFTKVGVSKDIAFAISLLGFFFILITGIAAGIIYFFFGHVFTLRSRRI